MAEVPWTDIDHQAASYEALHMPTGKLQNRCARTAAKAGKFLASAYAIIEPELAYFLELRDRLNAQGRRGGVEGWARWCEKHFSCSVRTVNRALSSLLGPEKERKKSRNWRAPAEALLVAVGPAIRLARKHADNDPDAAEFLNRLEMEDLDDLISEPKARSESLLDKLNKERRVKKDEIYETGLHLARAVMEGASAVNAEIPEGKKIIGIAKHMLEIKKTAGDLTLYQGEPQDEMSRSAGTNFVVDDLLPKLKAHNYYLVHVGMEDGKPIIAKYLGLQGKKHQFQRRALGVYNIRDITEVIRPANEKETSEELAWEDTSKKAVESARENQSKARKASGSM
jgi:hypothetical protein